MNRLYRTLIVVILLGAFCAPKPVQVQASHPAAAAPRPAGAPAMFIENVGQFAGEARFQVRGADRTIWLADDAIWVTLLGASAHDSEATMARDARDSLSAARKAVQVKLSFAGANPRRGWSPLIGLRPTCPTSSAAILPSGGGTCRCGVGYATWTCIRGSTWR